MLICRAENATLEDEMNGQRRAALLYPSNLDANWEIGAELRSPISGWEKGIGALEKSQGSVREKNAQESEKKIIKS